MKNKRYSETKFIKKQSANLACERLEFMDGEFLGNVSIRIEDNATCRKIRRIMEKRVCQSFWSNSKKSKRKGNGARYETRHQVSNHFKNIFGVVPQGFRYVA
jgi:hypothetical protein